MRTIRLLDLYGLPTLDTEERCLRLIECDAQIRRAEQEKIYKDSVKKTSREVYEEYYDKKS